jgi:hypothetical protein
MGGRKTIAPISDLLQIGHVDMALGNAPHLRALTHYVPLFDEHYVCLSFTSTDKCGASVCNRRKMGGRKTIAPISDIAIRKQRAA